MHMRGFRTRMRACVVATIAGFIGGANTAAAQCAVTYLHPEGATNSYAYGVYAGQRLRHHPRGPLPVGPQRQDAVGPPRPAAGRVPGPGGGGLRRAHRSEAVVLSTEPEPPDGG